MGNTRLDGEPAPMALPFDAETIKTVEAGGYEFLQIVIRHRLKPDPGWPKVSVSYYLATPFYVKGGGQAVHDYDYQGVIDLAGRLKEAQNANG